MAASIEKLMLDALRKFSSITSNPEVYTSVQEKNSKQFQNLTKIVYDSCKECESRRTTKKCVLPELITQDFDQEQIWQQIELQNDNMVSSLLSLISNIVTSNEVKFLSQDTCDNKKISRKHVKDQTRTEEIHSDIESNETESDTDEEITKLEAHLNDNDLDDDEYSDGENDELDFDFGAVGTTMEESGDSETEEPSDSEDDQKKNDKRNVSKKGSVVDDMFFKLADMEAFLDNEDAKEMRKQKGDEEDDSSDDEEDIDMFADIQSDDENEEGAGKLHYEDFFDPPAESETKSSKTKTKEKGKKAEHTKSENSEDQDSEEIESDDEDYEDEENKAGVSSRKSKQDLLGSDSEGEDVEDILGGKKRVDGKSSFEKSQQKLKAKISKMEEASIAEKPWQLSGEISASSRPENSLLAEHLVYDQTVRLPPVVTEETTQTLEEMIKQRIKDKAWDDVERKVKPTENPYEYKKRITLDQEKSKQSLGDIYEQEYLRQQREDEEEKEAPDHTEIKDMMKSLFIKLDALSNFHYTPKPAAPDIQIVSNLPTISMEEVAPVTHGDGTLLAPEEVKTKVKGEMKGKTEKSDTDRKRERRQKKGEKRKRKKEKEQRQKLVEKLNPGLGNKYSKEKAMRELEKSSKTAKTVTVLKENKDSLKQAKKLTSSKSFFTRLQEDAKIRISQTKSEKRKSDTPDYGSSKKYKL